MATATKNGTAALSEPSVDSNEIYATDVSMDTEPQIYNVEIEGVARILFHRYSCESVDIKAKAAKGSSTKKSDDIESYYYRDAAGLVCIPAENIHACICTAAKSYQDPRSARKSAMDLFKAGILVTPDTAAFLKPDGKTIKEADFIDRRRVRVQQSAISRERPGLMPGWTLKFQLTILTPELISPDLLYKVVHGAGQFCGLGDFRPQFGRFAILSIKRAVLE